MLELFDCGSEHNLDDQAEVFADVHQFIAVHGGELLPDQHVAEAKTTYEFLGYCIGGVTGDFLGIWVSKKFKI